MSGSSGGGGGSFDRGEIDCVDLKFTTQLASPQPQVVATLAMGQVLDVAVVTVQAVQALVALANGVTVGALVGTHAKRLRECVLSGHVYKATVVKLNGGQVTIEVEHV